MTMLRLVFALPIALALSGCLGGPSRAPGFAGPPPPGPIKQLDTSAEVTPAVVAPPLSRGSIYQATNGYANLVTGTRARSLGDIVTIVLIENTSTSKSASGTTNRDGSFGLTPPAGGLFDFIDPADLNASGDASFNGGGNAGQQSQLTGTVAVTIAAIYPNGTAEVVGEKLMSLSQGDEWVQFAGRIRLVDIDVENRLSSDQVANARIIYSGKGSVQQASRPGWFSRFFNAISPF